MCVCVCVNGEVRQPSVCFLEGGLYMYGYDNGADMSLLVYDYVETTTVLEDWSQHFIRENWPYLVVSH